MENGREGRSLRGTTLNLDLNAGLFLYNCKEFCCCYIAKSCLTLCNPMLATTACQASLSFTVSQSFLKLLSTELLMPSNHLILCHSFSSHPQSFPASGSFQMSWLFPSGGQSIGVSASASVLPVNIQGWFPLELTGLISLQSKGLSRVFYSTTIQKHQFFSIQPSLWSNPHTCT